MTDATPLTLDPFQVEAVAALDEGRSVLVAAPTGAGKTVVAEHAIANTLARRSGRAFYTTPIKALSNQKYRDLVQVHDARQVGLLTGDNAINGDAPVVVMTTEVLRNMIYARHPRLGELDVVVLDEVHYLQDTYRGPVWEEVIIHAPSQVRFVCLSATVSNAGELADWISSVRGPTEVVVEQRRPVELRNLYLVGDRSSEQLRLLPTLVDGSPNPEGERFDTERERSPRPGRGRPRRRFSTPRRVEVLDRLADEGLLPAITFIFSRAACDDAVRACLAAGLRLTTVEERTRIRELVDERTAGLSDGDLDVLDFDHFSAGLAAGIAAHHAGMVPPFKEAVEACFTEGLVKAVFATETLALGINMPARSVVIERLTKFGGERHDALTPAEYTQLTGRAGRRGIDEIGHAVVLWSPFVAFAEVAGLAASRSFTLRSVFAPTYNMAANLVRRYGPDEAHELLNRSFAQYQADRGVALLGQRRAQARDRLTRLAAEAACDRGDVAEYRALRAAHRRRGSAERAPATQVESALAALRPGDVIRAHGERRSAKLIVLSVAQRRPGTSRLKAVNRHRRVVSLGASDFDRPPRPVATIDLPEPFNPNSRTFQRQVAGSLERARPLPDGYDARVDAPDADATPAGPMSDPEAHPVAACPHRRDHLRAAAEAERTERRLAEVERRMAEGAGSLARRFDRILALLEARGHVAGWSLTDRGDTLARLYHESDLLVVEALHRGLFDDLDPAAVAGLVSCLTYEHRSKEPPSPPWFPSGEVQRRAAELEAMAAELNGAEAVANLPLTRRPDAAFFALAHAWASGQDLDRLLDDEVLSGGDFVRNVKTLIDLLRQVGELAPRAPTGAAARAAADALYRGVVAASSAVTGATEEL